MKPKFNAWDEETKTMYHAGNDHIVLDSDGTCYNLQTGNKLIPLFWTGKVDVNNKDVFDGDICKLSGDEYYSNEQVSFDDDWEFIGTVEFNSFMWLVSDKGDWIALCDTCGNDIDIEVIGNKYETSL